MQLERYSYPPKVVKQMLLLISKLEVKGVENANLLVNLYNLINNPMHIPTEPTTEPEEV